MTVKHMTLHHLVARLQFLSERLSWWLNFGLARDFRTTRGSQVNLADGVQLSLRQRHLGQQVLALDLDGDHDKSVARLVAPNVALPAREDLHAVECIDRRRMATRPSANVLRSYLQPTAWALFG